MTLSNINYTPDTRLCSRKYGEGEILTELRDSFGDSSNILYIHADFLFNTIYSDKSSTIDRSSP